MKMMLGKFVGLSAVALGLSLACGGDDDSGADASEEGDASVGGDGDDFPAGDGDAVDGSSGDGDSTDPDEGTGGLASSGDGSGGGSSDLNSCTDTGADEKFSFFATSHHHLIELAGTADGFGGDLRYNGAATGLEGADAICQEIASRVCHGSKTWRAFLSTSTVDAIDRIGSGPWYDYAGQLVADDVSGLTAGDRPAGGCCDLGVYDELGVYHDGSTDVNNDGLDDDDHDVLTGTDAEGRYNGFSCEDWTSTTAEGEATDDGGRPGRPGGGNTGPTIGHMWPAQSGQSWKSAHSAPGCWAGVNLVQNGAGELPTVGDAGGYGAIYCFAE